MTVPIHYLRAALNVGHGLEDQYVRRYQRALDAILTLCQPHADLPPLDRRDQTGSDFGRGYREALHALSAQIIAEMGRQVIGDEDGDKS